MSEQPVTKRVNVTVTDVNLPFLTVVSLVVKVWFAVLLMVIIFGAVAVGLFAALNAVL